MSSEGFSGFPEADSRSNFNTLGHGYLSEAPFTHAKRGIARLNRTSKLARRENVCEAADNAERPRSLGPARAPARRQGPRTAANRTGSSNPALFFCDIKDLLAVRGVSSEPVSALSLNSRVFHVFLTTPEKLLNC